MYKSPEQIAADIVATWAADLPWGRRKELEKAIVKAIADYSADQCDAVSTLSLPV